MSSVLDIAERASTADQLSRIQTTTASIYREAFVPTRTGKRIPIAPTGLDARSAAALRRVLQECGATRTIETGLALGLSSLAILEASLESAAMRKSGQVSHTAIDPFQAKDWGNAGRLTIERAGASDLVRFFEADSTLKLPELCAAGERFDAAFVDGGHLFEHVFLDTHYLLRMVRPGGAIVIDDWWMPAVRMGVDYFVKNLGVTREVRADIDGAERFSILRVPERVPTRAWDHFVEFGVMPR